MTFILRGRLQRYIYSTTVQEKRKRISLYYIHRTARDFTLENMVKNVDAVFEYVKKNYSDQIHLLGYTGAGGVFAQYYLAHNPGMKSFSQFACGIYGDATPLGVPSILAKPLLGVLRLVVKVNAKCSISYKPPKAKGYHANIDNEFYNSIIIREPHFFDLKINNVLRLMECVVGKKSLLKKPITCPTLVFKTLHDRFYSREYFDRYYENLTCKKKLIEIANRILVLDQGKLVEDGSHEELINKNGIYQKLYHMQAQWYL